MNVVSISLYNKCWPPFSTVDRASSLTDTLEIQAGRQADFVTHYTFQFSHSDEPLHLDCSRFADSSWEKVIWRCDLLSAFRTAEAQLSFPNVTGWQLGFIWDGNRLPVSKCPCNNTKLPRFSYLWLMISHSTRRSQSFLLSLKLWNKSKQVLWFSAARQSTSQSLHS